MNNRSAIVSLLLLSSVAACIDPPDATPATGVAVDEPAVVEDGNGVVARNQPLLDRVFKAADPAAEHGRLSAEDKAQFDRITQPVGEVAATSEIVGVPKGAITAAFTGCYAIHVTGKRKAFFGNTLYTFWQNTNVCVQNGQVTSVWLSAFGGETSTPGWRIAQGPGTQVVNVGWEGRGVALYHFVLGIGPWDAQHPSDCLQGRLSADAVHWRGMGSCDLFAP